MTSEPSELDPMDETAFLTQSEIEPSESLEELPITELPYPSTSKIELDPLELGDADDFSDHELKIESNFDALEFDDTVVIPIELLETPEGYTAPQFDSFDSSAEDQNLDALFAELAETASGQSSDIAVWCPWLMDASQN